MFVAPPLPAEARQQSRLVRELSGLLLAATAVVLVLLNVLLFMATQYFIATPEGLYHRVWHTTAQHIYDPSVLGDWAKWEHKYDGKLKSDDDAAQAIDEMLKSAKDRYTYFMDRNAVKSELERNLGNFTGVGLVFGVKVDANEQPVKAQDGKPLPETNDDGYPVVKQLIKGGPAKKAGLSVDDAIVSVDGKDTRGLSLDQLIKLIRGKAGEPISFGIRRQGKDFTLTITREKIQIPAVTTKHLSNDIGYLRLEAFDQFDATDEFKAGLADLADCKALIIDVRGNPGGFVHNAVNISSLFIKEGTVVSIRSRIPGDPKQPQYETVVTKLTASELVEETSATDASGTSTSSKDRQPYLAGGRPVVILVDGNSASAAEMFTGAVKDNGAAVVIGTRTFGKGIGQSSIPMPNATQLHVTSLRYFTPNGTWLGDGGNTKNNGIEPDIVVPAAKGLEFGESNDNQLEKALEVLKKKLGGGSTRPIFRTKASCAA